ncbi:flagellar basal body-associated FliL family protein [Anaerocolumna xylanovorans]|uniref:Flagellar FliL protein n=1 Tax=Anaerocolumna xylanovorans DSM 12503 TaxID=1121345 RepID=A0A1M7YB51_9FIRM|nr:hypothetical protein [Anaerocolumna xylanovorans]SHO49855.1 flagellar FliL protein [Anaerocolumna xylanovorans DSM 12503]
MGNSMKKSFLTVIILALGIVNMILTAVIVFAVVPTTMRTNELISKVASTIDLEINGSPANQEVSIEDIENYGMSKELTINLKKGTDNIPSYALVKTSLSLNTKSEDYAKLQPLVETNESKINEMIQNEFMKYTMDEVTVKKEEIKSNILAALQEYFKSDFIVGITIEFTVAQ